MSSFFFAVRHNPEKIFEEPVAQIAFESIPEPTLAEGAFALFAASKRLFRAKRLLRGDRGLRLESRKENEDACV